MDTVTTILLQSLLLSASASPVGIVGNSRGSLPSVIDTSTDNTDGSESSCIASSQSCVPEMIIGPQNQSLEDLCVGGCSGKGDCIGGHCVCKTGFRGIDCSLAALNSEDFPKESFERAEDFLRRHGSDLLSFSKNDDFGVDAPRYNKICIVTSEFPGLVQNGGIGSANGELANLLSTSGYNVTVLYTHGTWAQRKSFEHWQRHYESQGVRLIGLDRKHSRRNIGPHLTTSFAVYQYLRAADYDIVHFHDYLGIGYYSLVAKHLGIAFTRDSEDNVKSEASISSSWLQRTAFVLGAHGSSLWAKTIANGETIEQISDLEIAYMEQKSIEYADLVYSPSQYMLQHLNSLPQTALPMRSVILEYIRPSIPDPRLSDFKRHEYQKLGSGRVAVREVVFFGRLETRKGVRLFCEAIDWLIRTYPAIVEDRLVERITFLGRSALVEGVPGAKFVEKYTHRWVNSGLDVVKLEHYDSSQAQRYLMGGPRLAVIPSLIENSPNTVYECLAMGVPMIATNAGGIADLVHIDDHANVIIEGSKNVEQGIGHSNSRDILLDPALIHALSGKINDFLTYGAVIPRPAFHQGAIAETWLSLHSIIPALVAKDSAAKWQSFAEELPFVSVVLIHHNRPQLCSLALESIYAQDYPAHRFEVVLVDDGSDEPSAISWLDSIEGDFAERGWRIVRTKNQYLGAARNAGAEFARGRYIVFMDDDNYAKPHEISTFIVAMESSGADILTSNLDFFRGEGPPPDLRSSPETAQPSYLFLGGGVDVGAFKNCFGDANCCVRKTSFEAIGGYSTDYGVGYEDWEFYANATLRKFKLDVVPDSLYYYRFTKNSMQKVTNYERNRMRSLRPYLKMLPKALQEVVLAAVFPRLQDGSIGDPIGLASEGKGKFHGVSSDL